MEKDMFDVDESGQLHVMPLKKYEQSRALLDQSQAFTRSSYFSSHPYLH
jgi:hypothetical protein